MSTAPTHVYNSHSTIVHNIAWGSVHEILDIEARLDCPYKLRRRQFPVKLAFAMTLNKSQGQSVQHVGLDLRKPVFSHGQLYVALSRATSSTQIRTLLPPDNDDMTTLNVVYPEVLL